jgi:hypothetical protein
MSLLSYHGMQPRKVRATWARNFSCLRTLAVAASLATLVACGGGDDPIAVTSVSVTPATASVAIGATTQLAAATLDGNGTVITGRAVTWSTSNASLATVSGGLVTGVAPGPVTITATSEGKAGSAVVTVLPPPVATVTITPPTPTITETDTIRLTAALRSASGAVLTGRVVTWSSATTSAAIVNNAGLVTGISPGTSVITATSEGKTATVTITVTISPCNTSLALPITSGVDVTGTLAATDCNFGDDTFLDAYRLVTASATTHETVLRSTAFDAYLFIYTQSGQGLSKTAEDDDGGGGSDAKITGALPAGIHFILANSINEFGFGSYTLRFTSPFSSLTAGGNFTIQPAVQVERLSPAEAKVLRGLVRRRR